MMKFPKRSQFFKRLRRSETVWTKPLRHYHIQPGEENLCLVTTYTNELEMEVRKLMYPKENDVFLRVGSCCISPYDFDYLMRYRGKDQSFDKSLILGTFGTGIVLETGSKAQDKFKVGDHVVLEPGIYCGTCIFCMAGKTNLCPHIKYLGSEGLDGILCRFMAHPSQFTHKLPDGVSLELGTLATKVACCIHSYQRSGIRKDSNILMMGINLLGLLAIMIFKHLGVGNVLVAETNNYKLKMAQNLGAEYVIKLPSHHSPEYPEYLKQIINSIQLGDPDIVIDTLGTPSSIENSFNLTKSGGKLVLMHRMTRPITTKFSHTTLREIDLVGAYSYSHSSFNEALALLSNENIPFKKIVPIKIPLEKALDAFSHGRATGGEKIFIIVNSYDEKKTENTDDHKSSTGEGSKISDLTPVSQIPDQTKPSATTSKELSGNIPSETEKDTKEKMKTIPESSEISQTPAPQKPPTVTNNELSSSGSETEKGNKEKTEAIPDLTPFSKIPEPTKPTTTANNESPKSTVSETFKNSKEKTEVILDLTPFSKIPDTTKPPSPANNESSNSSASETDKHSKEKTETISEPAKPSAPANNKLQKSSTYKDGNEKAKTIPNSSKDSKMSELAKSHTQTSSAPEIVKGSEEKASTIPEQIKPPTNKEMPTTSKSEPEKGMKENTRKVPESKNVSPIPDPKKHPTSSKELSTSTSETEKSSDEKEEIRNSTPKIDKPASHDNKKNGEIKKERLYEKTLKPKNTKENENQTGPQDKEKTSEKNETEQDLDKRKGKK